MGARFALDAGRGRGRGPTRWVLVGAVAALLVVSATLTFGHSLQNLVSQPSLYGWNWDYAVQSSDGYGPVPQSTVHFLLRHNRGVAESGVWFSTLQLDGVEVPTLLASPGAPVAPPLVAGHGLEGKDQVVLGAATMAQLHKRLGETVAMRYVPELPPTAIRLTIVGVATMPAIGIAEGLHTSMGIGAVVPADNGRGHRAFGPARLLRVQRAEHGVPPGQRPDGARHGATRRAGPGDLGVAAAGQRAAQLELRRIHGDGARRATPGADRQLPVDGPDAPGARGRAGGGRDGCARPDARRLRAPAAARAGHFEGDRLHAPATAGSVLWQAGIVAGVGIIVGVPLGVALGRWLWTLFADEIGAVPAPVVPLWSLAVASLIALALAVGLSAVPGQDRGAHARQRFADRGVAD